MHQVATSTSPSRRWTTPPAGGHQPSPCPVRGDDIQLQEADCRRTKARMDAPTTNGSHGLPALIAAADRQPPGTPPPDLEPPRTPASQQKQFTADGQQLTATRRSADTLPPHPGPGTRH